MTISMEKPYEVGMDIGGTNTVFGVVDSNFFLCCRSLAELKR